MVFGLNHYSRAAALREHQDFCNTNTKQASKRCFCRTYLELLQWKGKKTYICVLCVCVCVWVVFGLTLNMSQNKALNTSFGVVAVHRTQLSSGWMVTPRAQTWFISTITRPKMKSTILSEKPYSANVSLSIPLARTVSLCCSIICCSADEPLRASSSQSEEKEGIMLMASPMDEPLWNSPVFAPVAPVICLGQTANACGASTCRFCRPSD